ncbi:MAG: hypothetical protein K5985_02185 [Lachnospiraceae bacterium]|nr:hypothetical protein [Lachnospiraceae bacterium]
MSGQNLQLGDLEKKQESLNKSGGINSQKAVFNTKKDEEKSDTNVSPYMNRVEELANYGTVSGNNRALIQNSVDLGRRQQHVSPGTREADSVRTDEGQGALRARPDLKVFTDKVMERGNFTQEATEASKHFLRQLTEWAGGFDSNDASFYKSMGIEGIMDCIYVDGMSLKNFVKEQYFYKSTNDHAEEVIMLRNYVALIAARGEHVITLARPRIRGNEAEVQFKNLEMDMTSVGAEEASRVKSLKERGNQVRSTLKKRMEADLVEQTGMALRKARGYDMDGFNRIEGAKKGLQDAGETPGKDTDEYRTFNKYFEKYNGGLQRLGLKPGRDDIDRPVAEELKKRCEKALEAANAFLSSDIQDEGTKKAVEAAKKELETDVKLLTDAIETKLIEEGARMALNDLLDSTAAGPGDGNDRGRDNAGNDEGDGNDDGYGDET